MTQTGRYAHGGNRSQQRPSSPSPPLPVNVQQPGFQSAGGGVAGQQPLQARAGQPQGGTALRLAVPRLHRVQHSDAKHRCKRGLKQQESLCAQQN